MDFILAAVHPERQRALPGPPGPGPNPQASLSLWGRVDKTGVTTGDDPVYGPALRDTDLERQPCAVHLQRTVDRHRRRIDPETLTHLDKPGCRS